MPIPWENNFNVNKSGLVTTGMGGYSDGSGNASVLYAHDDVTIPVPASLLMGDTLPALTYATGDIPKRTQVNNTTKWTVPFPTNIIRSRTLASVPAGANPITAAHGFLLKSYTLYYRVNTSDLTSITGTLLTTPLAAGAGLPTVTTETVTVSGGTLTQAANVYALLVSMNTPAFKTTDNTLIWGVVTIVVPTNTCDILGASWQVAMALE